MMPLVVFALGMPEHLWVLLSATSLVVLVPFVFGLAVSTYPRTIAASAVLALAWIPVAVIYGVELKARAVLVTGVMLLAIVGHTLRRLVNRLRAQRRGGSSAP
jgi:apolipoprotein N-acyltransferase